MTYLNCWPSLVRFRPVDCILTIPCLNQFFQQRWHDVCSDMLIPNKFRFLLWPHYSTTSLWQTAHKESLVIKKASVLSDLSLAYVWRTFVVRKQKQNLTFTFTIDLYLDIFNRLIYVVLQLDCFFATLSSRQRVPYETYVCEIYRNMIYENPGIWLTSCGTPEMLSHYNGPHITTWNLTWPSWELNPKR